jgi:hypothetical protein
VRGSSRSTRPGTRPATDRATAPRRRIAEQPSQLEAAEVIAEDIVEQHPAEAAQELERVARSTHPRHRTKPGSLLAARAATEYVYVAQDMRRILLVAGLLFGVLLLLWLVVVMLKVIPLPFY